MPTESKTPFFKLDNKSVKDLALTEMSPKDFTRLLESFVQSKHLSGQLAWEYDKLFSGFKSQEMERREKEQAEEREKREKALLQYGSEWV